jgi:hypothetical protein
MSFHGQQSVPSEDGVALNGAHTEALSVDVFRHSPIVRQQGRNEVPGRPIYGLTVAAAFVDVGLNRQTNPEQSGADHFGDGDRLNNQGVRIKNTRFSGNSASASSKKHLFWQQTPANP